MRLPRASWVPILLGLVWLSPALALDYPLVYVRSPRDVAKGIRIAEVYSPVNVEAGTDLMLRDADGTTRVLVAGGAGGIVDPQPSFDAQWVYFARFHDLTKRDMNKNYPHGVSSAGADLYKIKVDDGTLVQLTFGEWTPNTGVAVWSSDPLKPVPTQSYYPTYKPFNTGPAPLPGGCKVIFTSNRNTYQTIKGYTWPLMQLFVLDECQPLQDKDGKVTGYVATQVGYFNLGSALHPVVLRDGRVMFSTQESQGMRDQRLWGLWAIWPDGRSWEPLISAFVPATAFHWQGQRSDGMLGVIGYYNLNNWGFGTLMEFAEFPLGNPMAAGTPRFGDPVPTSPTNPVLTMGYPEQARSWSTRWSTSPKGLLNRTTFGHNLDKPASLVNGQPAGKVSQPSGEPGGGWLLAYGSGVANTHNGGLPTTTIALLPADVPAVDDPAKLVMIVPVDPAYNLLQPKALVPYSAIYGIPEPATLPWLPNDGTAHPALPPGTPYGIVGTSNFDVRNSAPGTKDSNWRIQGSDAGDYADDDIVAVRLVALEPTSDVARGPGSGPGLPANFRTSPTPAFVLPNEKFRNLGEIPLTKYTSKGEVLLDETGHRDTSFLAKIPADMAFTFQALDKDGQVLTMAQTWHQVRPGEVRNDCGGCHGHSRVGRDIKLTAAGKPGYQPADLTKPLPPAQRDVEWNRDIKPLLAQYCRPCDGVAEPLLTGISVDGKKADTTYVLPLRSRLSPLMGMLGDAPPEVRRLVAKWIDFGVPVSLKPPESKDGWWRDEQRPTLALTVGQVVSAPAVICPVGCVATQPPTTKRTVRFGLYDAFLDLKTFKVILDGADITNRVAPDGTSENVWLLLLDATEAGVLTATVCDQPGPPGEGNCTTRQAVLTAPAP